MENPFEFDRNRYAPDNRFSRDGEPEYIIHQQFFASIIGVAAIGLPVVMLASAAIQRCFYDSISHFYYAAFFGDILVVTLAIIGVFLLAYRGRNPKENLLASYAGLGALAIALFPTTGTGLDEKYCSGRGFFTSNNYGTTGPEFELFLGVGFLHYIAAATLFAFLAYYTLVVFTRPIHRPDYIISPSTSPNKAKRNLIYRLSGIAIVLSLSALLLYATFGQNWEWWTNYNLTFWFESVALWAFGISWCVKGRIFGSTLLDEEDLGRKGEFELTTPVTLWKSIVGVTGFLASAFGVYQGYIHFFPPSQAVPIFSESITVDETEIIQGVNRKFAQFVRGNVSKVVFIQVPLTIPNSHSPSKKICGMDVAAEPTGKSENEYVLWYPTENLVPPPTLEEFCNKSRAVGDASIRHLIFQIREHPEGKSCARTRIDGDAQNTYLIFSGFYRVSHGIDFDAVENFELVPDIPIGKVFDDTFKITKHC